MLFRSGYVKGSPIIKIEQMDTCAECINKMLEYSQITRINEVKRMSALMLLFATIMEDNASDAQEDDNIEYPSKIYVKAAVDFITEKYMNKIKIDDIADFIGISRSHLTGASRRRWVYLLRSILSTSDWRKLQVFSGHQRNRSI